MPPSRIKSDSPENNQKWYVYTTFEENPAIYPAISSYIQLYPAISSYIGGDNQVVTDCNQSGMGDLVNTIPLEK